MRGLEGPAGAGPRGAPYNDDVVISGPGLAAISFANPALLPGLSAAALPLLIHLLTKRRPRDVVFPTIRLLRAATASQTRLHRWRHLILLVLRSVFLLLLALAFARPVWFASAQEAAVADRATTAVILLDISASMGYAGPPVATFPQGAARAAAILDDLRPFRGDRANVITVASVARPLMNRPTSNLAALRGQLERIAPTAERADAAAAIAAAAQQLAEARGTRRELHIVSDFQRENWAGADFGALPGDTRITLHRPGGEDPRPNVAITGVTCEPARPVAGQPARVSVRLANHSPRPQRRDVLLRIGGDAQWQRANVALAPDSSAAVQFDVRFNHPDLYELTAEIPPDSLAADDRWFAVVRAVETISVVLCTDQDLRSQFGSSRLLRMALAPLGDRRDLDVRVVGASALSRAGLERADVVVIDAADPLPPEAVSDLDAFIEGGGGAVFFLGPGACSGNLARLAERRPDRDVLPFQPTEPVQPTGGEPARIAVAGTMEHPILRPFAGQALRGLQTIQLYRYFATLPARRGAEVIAILGDGTPAIAVAPWGRGTVLLCNVSPDPGWSDLARHAIFPGLVHEFVRYVGAHGAAELSTAAGTASTRRWLADQPLQDVRITDPSGEPIRATIRRDGPHASVTLDQLRTPGFYRIRVGERVVESVAVNVDPRESDLTGDSDETLLARIRQARGAVLHPVTVAGAPGDAPEGRPLWPLITALAGSVLVVEMFCLIGWRR